MSDVLNVSDLSQTVAAQKVVIINGNPKVSELLDDILEPGYYNIIFLESSEHSYTQVKYIKPNLVILCVSVDDMDGLQVLSMMKFDEETKNIPVMTHVIEQEESDSHEEDQAESQGTEMYLPHTALMN